MIECSLITYHKRDLAHLPVPPVFIYDILCILIFYDHYHEQSISYKVHPNRLNNYICILGNLACFFIVCSFIYFSFYLNKLI